MRGGRCSLNRGNGGVGFFGILVFAVCAGIGFGGLECGVTSSGGSPVVRVGVLTFEVDIP